MNMTNGESSGPRRRVRKARHVTHRQRVLAARITLTCDAREGRESDPGIVALAKQTIYNPHGAEIRYRWPEKSGKK